MARESLGERMTSFRQAAGLSQAELAERAVVSLVALEYWERGVGRPTAPEASAIAGVLGVSLERLLDGTPEG